MIACVFTVKKQTTTLKAIKQHNTAFAIQLKWLRKQHQQVMQQNRTLRTESMLTGQTELLQGDEWVSKYAE